MGVAAQRMAASSLLLFCIEDFLNDSKRPRWNVQTQEIRRRKWQRTWPENGLPSTPPPAAFPDLWSRRLLQQGRYPGSQDKTHRLPIFAHSNSMMHPHLLTVAGAAQALNLFPVYPGNSSPSTLKPAHYTSSCNIYPGLLQSNDSMKSKEPPCKTGRLLVRRVHIGAHAMHPFLKHPATPLHDVGTHPTAQPPVVVDISRI